MIILGIFHFLLGFWKANPRCFSGDGVFFVYFDLSRGLLEGNLRKICDFFSRLLEGFGLGASSKYPLVAGQRRGCVMMCIFFCKGPWGTKKRFGDRRFCFFFLLHLLATFFGVPFLDPQPYYHLFFFHQKPQEPYYKQNLLCIL